MAAKRREKSSKLLAVLHEERQPDTLQAWKKLHANVKLRVQYENGEEEIVDIKRVEPDGDLDSPKKGASICCKAKGSRYTATIVDVIGVDSEAEKVKKDAPNPKPRKRKVLLSDALEEKSKKARKTENGFKVLQEKAAREAQLAYFISFDEEDSSSSDGVPSEEELLSAIISKELEKHLKPISQSLGRIMEKLTDMARLPVARASSEGEQAEPQTDPLGDKLHNLIKESKAIIKKIPSTLPTSDITTENSVAPTLAVDHDISRENSVTPCWSPASTTAPQSLLNETPVVDPSTKPEAKEMKEVDQKVNTVGRGPKPTLVQYAEVGGIRLNAVKLALARKAPNAFKMARKLLPEFFTPDELKTSTCVPPKPGKPKRPQADQAKLNLLLGEVRKVYPGGWDDHVMLSKLNQGFIDFRNKHT